MTSRIRSIVIAAVAAVCALPATAQAAAPTVSVQPPALSASTSAHFEFSYPAAFSYFCSLDGAAVAPCASPYDLTGLGEGSHTLAITANYMDTQMLCIPMPPGPDLCTPMPMPTLSDPVNITFAIDTTAPVVTQTNGPKDRSASRSTNRNFVFSSSEAGTGFACTLDGKPVTPCASPLALKKLSVGVHKLTITPTDAAGNAGAPLVRYFAVNSRKKTFKFTGGKVKRCVKKKSGKKSCKKLALT